MPDAELYEVKSILFDTSNNLWIGAYNGLFALDPGADPFTEGDDTWHR